MFSPSAEDVAHARRVKEAMGDGTGAVMLDGRMEDDASLKQCLVILELAERLSRTTPSSPSCMPCGLPRPTRRRADEQRNGIPPPPVGPVPPGNNERALEKAKTLPVDGLILDLEDAVAPDHKEVARENACAAARSGTTGSAKSPSGSTRAGPAWHEDDISAACAAGPDGILVPKVGSADEVRDLVAAMEHHGAPEHTRCGR